MNKLLKSKIFMYCILVATITSCKQEVKEQSTPDINEKVLSVKEVNKDDAIVEAFIENEKIVFTNDLDKAYKDLVYYDHSAIETSGLNYQIGGNGPYGSVIGIGLSTIKVGTYSFSRENKRIFTVDIEINYEGGAKESKFERSDKGSITITKSENNLISGYFSGTGLTQINDESLVFTSVKIHGTFSNIPLLETPK